MDKQSAIIIIGNMASGKSSVCKLLLEEMPDYKFISLDDYRNRESINTGKVGFSENMKAETRCFDEIKKTNKLIFESSGANRFYKKVIANLHERNCKPVIIKLDCPANICIRRFYKRKQSGHFQAFAFREYTPEDTVKHIAKVLKSVTYDFVFNSARLKPELIVAEILKVLK